MVETRSSTLLTRLAFRKCKVGKVGGEDVSDLGSVTYGTCFDV